MSYGCTQFIQVLLHRVLGETVADGKNPDRPLLHRNGNRGNKRFGIRRAFDSNERVSGRYTCDCDILTVRVYRYGSYIGVFGSTSIFRFQILVTAYRHTQCNRFACGDGNFFGSYHHPFAVHIDDFLFNLRHYLLRFGAGYQHSSDRE